MQLGQLITNKQYRDAIHLAIAPAIANGVFKPGQHVKHIGDGVYDKCDPWESVGIVDPFLIHPTKKNDTFWLCLKPHSITTIRHVWCHPNAPDEDGTVTDQDYALLAITAEICGRSYNGLIADMNAFADNGDWIYENSESYKDVSDWNPVWKAWERATGNQAPDNAWGPYTCSC